jgi:hypothetical protein
MRKVEIERMTKLERPRICRQVAMPIWEMRNLTSGEVARAPMQLPDVLMPMARPWW